MDGLRAISQSLDSINTKWYGLTDGLTKLGGYEYVKHAPTLGIKCTNQNTAAWSIPNLNLNGGTITLSMWIYPTGFPSNLGFILGTGTYFFEITSNGLMQYALNNTQRAFGATGRGSLTLKANQWSHIVFQIDSSGFFLAYHNGILVGRNKVATLAALGLTWTTGTQDFLGFGTNETVLGYVCEVAMWKVPYVTPATGTNNTGTYVMPAWKIKQLCNRRAGMPMRIDRPFLQFYYKMNDLGVNKTATATSKLIDYSGNGRTGSNFGGATTTVFGSPLPVIPNVMQS